MSQCALTAADIDWRSRYESSVARAAYYQRLADHHRKGAEEALERLKG